MRNQDSAVPQAGFGMLRAAVGRQRWARRSQLRWMLEARVRRIVSTHRKSQYRNAGCQRLRFRQYKGRAEYRPEARRLTGRPAEMRLRPSDEATGRQAWPTRKAQQTTRHQCAAGSPSLSFGNTTARCDREPCGRSALCRKRRDTIRHLASNGLAQIDTGGRSRLFHVENRIAV